MTIATRRTLLLPYNESLQSEFLMLNCCAKNRAEMNGPHTVASAKQLFQKLLHDPNLYSMAVLDNTTREYIGHVFISNLDGVPELGFIFDKLYWGKGLASEALKAFFPKALRERQIEKVIASVNLHHAPCLRLLQKLGFVIREEKQDGFGPYYELEFTSDAVVDESSLV